MEAQPNSIIRPIDIKGECTCVLRSVKESPEAHAPQALGQGAAGGRWGAWGGRRPDCLTQQPPAARPAAS